MIRSQIAGPIEDAARIAAWLGCLFLSLWIQSRAIAQSDTALGVAPSSDLAAALPPAQWTAVERSVDRGLRWLANQQAQNGSFAGFESGQPAITSVAVMAFLSRGHVPNQGPYGKQLTEAIDYVLSTQRPDGSFSTLPWQPPFQKDLPSHTVAYNHPIAGLMLGEVYGMTSGRQEAAIREAIIKALDFSRAQQTKKKLVKLDRGGWRYPFPTQDSPTVLSDLSVTSWQFMFLRSARNAEFEVPQQYVDEGIEFVIRCFTDDPQARPNGVFRYSLHGGDQRPTNAAMTGAGMLCLQLSGHHEHEYVRQGADWLRDNPIPPIEEWGHFYYGTYYDSQAMAQMGGDYWRAYFPRLVSTLAPLQNENGSWNADAWEGRYSQCYCTSMAILSLTPPYQLLPIYQR